MRLIFFFILFIYFRQVESESSTTVNWNIQDDEKLPIIEIGFKGVTFTIPLREAPFCHLWVTNKCECFMTRGDNTSTEWAMASFAYCDDTISGHFMNDTVYFEIFPIENGKYNVTEYLKTANVTGSLINDTYSPPGRPNFDLSQQYIRPSMIFGLKDYETGFIPCLFVIDRELFRYESERKIDFFLQGLINNANELLFQFNLIAVYRGWKEAYPDDAKITKESVLEFLKQNFARYIQEGTQNLAILFSPKMVIHANRTFAGNAIPDSICDHSTGIYVNYLKEKGSYTKREQAKTLLHEIGHALGMKDGNDGCPKPPKGIIHIMGDLLFNKPGRMQWSGCSKKVVKSRRRTYYCLREKIKPHGKSCRNGILEEGEQCECVSEACQKCCDINCQLTENSECSSGPCCDKTTCKPRTKEEKYTCRTSSGPCDIPEMCSGKTAKCPVNYVVADGYGKYSPDRGYCFNGMLGSRKDVCEWMYTNGKVGEDRCYEMNLYGGDFSGCGPTFAISRRVPYFACRKENILCGKIICQYQPLDALTSEFNVSRYKNTTNVAFLGGCSLMALKNNTRFLREDPTFVQNGSECGDGKMCVKQECVPLPSGCPENCHGAMIEHPDTHELLPAYKLPVPDEEPETVEPEEPEEPYPRKPDRLNNVLYLITILFGLIIFGLGGMYLASRLKNENSQHKGNFRATPSAPSLLFQHPASKAREPAEAVQSTPQATQSASEINSENLK